MPSPSFGGAPSRPLVPHSAAAPYIDGRELARWSRRLDEELSDVARLLQGLAGEPQ